MACILSEGPAIDVTDLREEIACIQHDRSGVHRESSLLLSVIREHRGNLSPCGPFAGDRPLHPVPKDGAIPHFTGVAVCGDREIRILSQGDVVPSSDVSD